MKPVVDHLVYAAPDLEMGVNALAELLGARATPGGKHVGLGTHNALLGLGEGTYIEIIAPDPEQPRPERPLPFGLASVRAPRLATFAVRTTDIDALVASSRDAGYDPGAPIDMSRTRPDGVVLKWRLAYHLEMPAGGVIPFVIDWGDTPHPSAGLPNGGKLIELRAQHPDPDSVRSSLAALGFEMEVVDGSSPQLTATIDAGGGRRVDLR